MNRLSKSASTNQPPTPAATVIGTNLVIDYGSEEAARAALDSWPGLDGAWREAEAALPEGWSVWGLVGWPGDTPDQWRATAVQHGEGEDNPFVDGHGPTPEGALYALVMAIAAEYARLLPTQASDSPETP